MKRIFPILFTVVIVLNAGLLSAIKSRLIFTENLEFSSFKDGDLIVRNGKGLVSHWFRKMSLKDSQFSHAGLIAIENNRLYVYHAYQEGSPSGLIKESFTQFINPDLCDKYEIFRYNLTDHERREVKLNMQVDLSKHLPFDNEFELNNGNAVYCTEWIHNCLNTSLNDLNYISCSILKDFKYVSIDNLYFNIHTKKILFKKY